ncbi:MAG: hypothetical protein EBV30_10860 [Actinobacteria bacterium]|nr:hypothetical protein [Actinomycetota bacterium]
METRNLTVGICADRERIRGVSVPRMVLGTMQQTVERRNAEVGVFLPLTGQMPVVPLLSVLPEGT